MAGGIGVVRIVKGLQSVATLLENARLGTCRSRIFFLQEELRLGTFASIWRYDDIIGEGS